MDAESGRIYHGALKDLYEQEMKKKLTPLPSEGEVIEIRGCNFLVTGYDEQENTMILKGISKEKALSILMGSKP